MAEARSDEFAGMADELRELADRLAEQARLAASLTASLASRSVIDQAIGIIMSQNRCDAEEAMDVPAPSIQQPQRQTPRPRHRNRHCTLRSTAGCSPWPRPG